VLVSGTGFTVFAAIDIYFDTTDVALAIANGSGPFSNIAIQVPASALPGTHWVSAVMRYDGRGAQAGNRSILASRAPALLRAITTALRRRVINVRAVAGIDSDVLQGFAFQADIAVLLFSGGLVARLSA
jgi:hypothetical protein